MIFRKVQSMQLNSQKEVEEILSTWLKREPMLFQLLKMLDIHKNTECLYQWQTSFLLMLLNQIKEEFQDSMLQCLSKTEDILLFQSKQVVLILQNHLKLFSLMKLKSLRKRSSDQQREFPLNLTKEITSWFVECIDQQLKISQQISEKVIFFVWKFIA